MAASRRHREAPGRILTRTSPAHTTQTKRSVLAAGTPETSASAAPGFALAAGALGSPGPSLFVDDPICLVTSPAIWDGNPSRWPAVSLRWPASTCGVDTTRASSATPTTHSSPQPLSTAGHHADEENPRRGQGGVLAIGHLTRSPVGMTRLRAERPPYHRTIPPPTQRALLQ